jgi:hypothetical protein
VSSACRRLLSASLFAACAALAAAAPPEPTREQVARWVKELGDNDFAAREEASRRLWEAGRASEDALRDAAKSDDAEVARRARDILDRFKWGVYPDTPAKVAELVAQYQAADVGGKGTAVRELLQAGPHGYRSLAKIARAEEDPGARRQLFAQLANEMARAVPLLLAGGDRTTLEMLLDITLENDVRQAAGHYTAYWLLRGRLDDRIAHARALAAKSPDDKKPAELLAYLYRAKGDTAAARSAAEKADRPDLVEALLYEAGDWKELARLAAAGGDDRAERLGYRAAYARLAGDSKSADEVLAELRRFAEENKEQAGPAFVAAKGLFLNDRPADGLAALRAMRREVDAFEVLAAQQRFAEAFALADSARSADGKELPELELAAARVRYTLGEKDRARSVFTRYAGQIKPEGESGWYDTLVEAEARAGLKDDARAHAGKALDANKDPGQAERILGKLFPDKGEEAAALWAFLRKRHADRPGPDLVAQVAALLEGKAAAKEAGELLDAGEEAARGLPDEEGDRLRVALAEAAAAAGLAPRARAVLENAKTAAGLQRLGDLLAEDRRWAPAADRYRQAWERDQTKPLPYYLWGHALAQAGQAEEGRRRTDQAHWLPLGDEAARKEFAAALAQRGFRADARRELDLLTRVSQPASYYSGEAQRRLAVLALARGDYLAAAEGHEKAMLRCLRAQVGFVQPGAYVAVPALVHRLRARGLVGVGRFDEARREVDRALAALPGNVDVAILLVPELEKAGRKEEAKALYDAAHAAAEALCRDYPDCPWAHNSVAWLSACCRRDLDEALLHARRAVALAPEHAGHLDTLAEVHFQRGEKEQAVSAARNVAAMDARRVYFRKQLRRMEAGDPNAVRPPEGDGEDEE